MWSQPAERDDITVVSDIGEQWSPHTAPASTPETERIENGVVAHPR